MKNFTSLYTLHQAVDGILVAYTYRCTRHEYMYCVDVLANVTVNVLTGRPSEVQSFQHHPGHQVECAHSSLEIH